MYNGLSQAYFISTEGRVQLVYKGLIAHLLIYGLQLPDKVGREPRLMIWSHPGNDVTGMVPRCEKVSTTCEKVSNLIYCL